MPMRTPSKYLKKDIVLSPSKEWKYDAYLIQYVSHGKAIRYSSIEKNMKRKVVFPVRYSSATYRGLVDMKTLMEFPYIPPSSEAYLLWSLPVNVVKHMKRELIRYVLNQFDKDDMTITMLVYGLKR